MRGEVEATDGHCGSIEDILGIGKVPLPRLADDIRELLPAGLSFFQERFGKTVVLLISAGASRADAEDATQEAMIQAWQHWKSIREPTAWLRTVAFRAWLKQGGIQRFRTVPLDDADRSTILDPDLSIFTAEQQQVLRLLRALPPMQRAVAAMFYDGASCGEIAELLDISDDTVRSHLRHARRALREMMTTGDL